MKEYGKWVDNYYRHIVEDGERIIEIMQNSIKALQERSGKPLYISKKMGPGNDVLFSVIDDGLIFDVEEIRSDKFLKFAPGQIKWELTRPNPGETYPVAFAWNGDIIAHYRAENDDDGYAIGLLLSTRRNTPENFLNSEHVNTRFL